jgi:iron(III) transport system permease protein
MGWSINHWQERTACAISSAILLVLLAPPLIAVAAEALTADAAIWQQLVRPRSVELLLNSLTIAATTTLSSLFVGVLLGTVLGRANLRFGALALFLHCVPLTLPPFVSALTAFHLFGRGGWLAQLPTSWLFGNSGCIMVLTVCLTPIITVLTWLGVRATDPSGDEAARIVGGARRTLRQIVLPQALPAIALGAIIVFSLALIEIAVPMFLRVDVYSAAIFARLGGFDFAPGEAAILALPLLGMSMLLWLVERASPAHAVIALPRARQDCIALLDTKRARMFTTMLAVLAGLFGISPIVVMSVEASRGNGFAQLVDYAGDAMINSTLYAAGVSTIVVVLAVASVSVARQYPRFVKAQDALTWLGFLLPPALFSLGAISIWNRPGTQWLYGSAGVIVLALAARYAVLAIRIGLSGEQQLSPSLIDAARVHGARYLQRLLQVQLPALWRFISGAWFLVFVFCLRDIETTALLYPPGGDPLTVRLFTLEANGPPAVVAAMTVALASMTLVPLAAASLFLGRSR